MADTEQLDPLGREIADACRVLAARELADGILGHISVRVDAARMLVRCRGPEERGLAWTEPADIRLVGVDGSGDPGDGYALPAELPLHTEVLAARPDIRCVVHAHPFAVVAADLAGHPIRPLLGAYDLPGAHLARRRLATRTDPARLILDTLRRNGITTRSTSSAGMSRPRARPAMPSPRSS